jgi:hypothetical protein
MTDSRHNGPAASLRRIRLIARHTLGEALHLRLTLLLGLAGAGLVCGAWWLREFNFGAAELMFLGDFGLGAVSFLGALLAVLATVHLWFGEIESRAVHWVLTRPVRRWEYLTGKFAGVAGVLAVFVAMLSLVLGGIIALRESQLHASFVPLPVFLQACALVWLKLALVAALTLLVCSYAGSALFASCTGILLTLVAHLRPVADENAGLGWLRVWPDLGLFDASALLVAGHTLPSAWLLSLTLYWTAYALILVALSSYAFKHREF